MSRNVFNVTLSKAVRLAFVCSCFWLASCSSNQTVSISDIVAREVAELRQDEQYEAVSIVVVSQGQIDEFHFGELSDGSIPNSRTLFEIGSLTKTYTGLLLARTVADGKIELDAPIENYLPQFRKGHFSKTSKRVTVRDLAAHTSGLPVNIACNTPNLNTQSKFNCYKTYDNDAFWEALNKAKLLDMPGESYRYSNAGIRLLSLIIEGIYGMTYPELLERFVFPETGEQDTLFRLNKNELVRLAIGKDQLGQTMPSASEYYFGAGALKTTTQSFSQYMTFYLEQSSLSQKALEILAGDESGLGRAYVWNTFRYSTENMYYHAGGTLGTSSWVALYPQEKIGVFIVTPLSTADAQQRLNKVSNNIVKSLRKRAP
jgi:CubicO group peptidase (beta-lactamase class C family)